MLIGASVIGGCNASPTQQAALPTATLAPIVSQTPRFTATPVPSRTALPTLTETPSLTPIPPTPSNTFTPSPTPPVLGSVFSADDVNVREGPEVTFPAIDVLRPGTGVEILGFSADGRWLNVRMEDGDEGWISAALIRIQPSLTPIPSLTPTLDRTAEALGTVYPTALLGGQPVTPTPPAAITRLTPGAEGTDAVEATEAVSGGVALPNMAAIELTATALTNLGLPQLTTAEPTRFIALGGPTGGPLLSGSPTAPIPLGTTVTQRGTGVAALCDTFGGRPSNLAAGSTISVFWRWYAATAEQVDQHTRAVDYDVQLDGVRIANWQGTASAVREDDTGFYREWFVPVSTPLNAGEHRITYRATWSSAISDGLNQFGPGTSNLEEVGGCTFTVR